MSAEKFLCVYNSLPPDARLAFMEREVSRLMETASKDSIRTAIASASTLNARMAAKIPLDLRSKRIEIDILLDILTRDAKTSFVKGRSNKDELLAQVIDSLVGWLQAIWSAPVEYRTDFTTAHQCLIYAAKVLKTVATIRGGCKCATLNMHISTSIKNRRGDVVKSFNLPGAKLHTILLWIWRDLFVSLLAYGDAKQIQHMDSMIEDIEGILDWPSLERMLYGGTRASSDNYNNTDKEDECIYSNDSESESQYYTDTDSEYSDTDEEVEGSESESDVSSRSSEIHNGISCSCRFRAAHWTHRQRKQQPFLRSAVERFLFKQFALVPSLHLYDTLIEITQPSHAPITEFSLNDILAEVATSTADTLAAALEIHTFNGSLEDIIPLLDHTYLLRIRDAPAYADAVTALAVQPSTNGRALKIMETELLDTLRTLHAAMRLSFPGAEEQVRKDAVRQIARSRAGTATRADRVAAWVDAVVPPGAPAPHPLNLMAAMFGFPAGPDMGMDGLEDDDYLSYADVDPMDPDLDDLREEFRPLLKDRLETWIQATETTNGGTGVLLRFYRSTIEMMPWFLGPDVVDEMITRIADKPSKHHICDILDHLSTFCKSHRKRASSQRKKDKATVPKPPASAPTPPSPSDDPPPLEPIGEHYYWGSSPGAGSSNQAAMPTFGGMADVD